MSKDVDSINWTVLENGRGPKIYAVSIQIGSEEPECGSSTTFILTVEEMSQE